MRTALALALLFAAPDADPPRRTLDPANCGLIRTIAPLGGTLNGLSFSPDGRRLAVGCGEGVRIYDTQTWREIVRLDGHPNMVLSVAFSPDGRRLAAGGFEGAIVIWDAAGPREKTLQGHTSYVPALAWRPDGRVLLSGSLDATARVWDASEGKQLHALGGHQAAVLAAAFAPDGRRAFTAGGNNTVKVWDSDTWAEARTIAGAPGLITAAAFSADGRIATATGEGEVRVRRLEPGAEDRKFDGHASSVSRLAFTPEGRYLLSASSDTYLCIWNARRPGEPLAKLRHHAEPLECVALHPYGRFFVTLGQDRHLKVWGFVPGGMARVRPKGFCGIRVQPDASGAILIGDVIDQTPAAEAGLRRGDLLRKVGGVAIVTPTDSVDKIGSYLEGEEVDFEIERAGATHVFRIKLGKRPATLER